MTGKFVALVDLAAFFIDVSRSVAHRTLPFSRHVIARHAEHVSLKFYSR